MVRRLATDTRGSVMTMVLMAVLAVLVMVMAAVRYSDVGTVALAGARPAANEASAAESLRAINVAQTSYAASCASGGFATTLDDLAKPPVGALGAFVGADLRTNGVVKSGYRITLEKDGTDGVAAIETPDATCNAPSAAPVSSYFARAEPVDPQPGSKYFATDARGIIYTSGDPIANPIVRSEKVVPVQR